MLLMNGDIPVLQFHLDDMFIRVINNDFLPYALRDYIQDTDLSCREAISSTLRYIACIKDYLCSRTLNLSRENAKAILHTLSLPQRLHTEEMLKIVFICSGLSMIDNYWLKEDSSSLSYMDVNLRKNHLKDAAYEISLLGHNITATREIMQPDIGTDGMFAKTWYRGVDEIELWKTSNMPDSIHAKVEKKVSDILDSSNVRHVRYSIFERDGKLITSCKCITNDLVSMINGYELRDWCFHTGRDFLSYIEQNFLEDFSKMCVVDYVVGNTDRHLGNVNFLVNNDTGRITQMAPLFDHNQALICDYYKNQGLCDDLIYEPTGKTMIESALKYFEKSNINIDDNILPEKPLQRFKFIKENHHRENSINQSIQSNVKKYSRHH